jgi:hypothetical protein
MVPHWNKFDDDFVLSMFGFVNKYFGTERLHGYVSKGFPLGY